MNYYDSRPAFEKLRRIAAELRQPYGCAVNWDLLGRMANPEAKPDFKPVTQPPWMSPWDVLGQVQQEKQR